MKNIITFSLIVFVITLFGGYFLLTQKINTNQLLESSVLGVNSKKEIQPINEAEHLTVKISQPQTQTLLSIPTFVSQTFNNCGPANLAMLFNFWGTPTTQQKIAEDLRPFNNPKGGVDDKAVFNDEMASYAKLNGFESLVRPNGDIEKIKMFLANGIPVVVSAWLHKNEDIGHYRLVKGFDDFKKIIITDDSYLGPNQNFSYQDFNEMWQPFNYVYLVVYPSEKAELVNKILGDETDQNISYQKSIEKAELELKNNPDNPYPSFNISTANYQLGNFQKTVEQFEKIESKLPARMLWYQLEPLFAYQQTGKFEKALEHADKLLNTGNLAFSEMYQLKGEIFLKQDKKEEAREMFKKALFYNKNYTKAKESLKSLP